MQKVSSDRRVSDWVRAVVLGLSLLACGAGWAQVPAVASNSVAAAPLVPFASEEGLLRLARVTAKLNFAALANQFEAQSNAAFCGPTSAAIVLNAVNGRGSDAPRDRSRLRPEDFANLPAGFDPTVARFTQDSVIARGLKPRAVVLGEPVEINGKTQRDFGYQLRQLDAMLRANGLATRMVVVDADRSAADIRADLVDSLERAGNYAIVAYRRETVGQKGGGHISPLGAFDAQSDSFLVMDVNPSSAGWVWMAASTLIAGMRTFDTVENRGYVLVAAR